LVIRWDVLKGEMLEKVSLAASARYLFLMSLLATSA
jgi:hypothetical protein